VRQDRASLAKRGKRQEYTDVLFLIDSPYRISSASTTHMHTCLLRATTVRFNVWSSTSRNYTLASMLAVWGQRALEHSRMTALRCVKLLAPACYLSERFNKYWGHLRVRRTRMRMKCSTELSLGRTRIRMNLRKPILRGHQRAVQWRTFQMIKRSNMDLNKRVGPMVTSLGAASDQKQ
jgi:hypothetical protein